MALMVLTEAAVLPLQLVLHSLDPASSQYNQPLPLALHGEVDAGLLQQSLQAVVSRHAPLRTVFKPSVEANTPWVPVTYPGSGGPCRLLRGLGRLLGTA